jgi:predicted deacylase
MRIASMIVLGAIQVAAQPPAGVWNAYHDPAGISAEFARLARAFPSLIKVESLGKSVQDRDIWLVTIAKDGGRNKPEVLFDGAMHGSEVIGSESLLAYARFLLEHYETDSRVRRLVDGSRTYIIPMVNPDGVEAGKTARSWKMARKNAHGVNLNRNFDWNWEEAGAEDPAKENYRGPKAFSEPESRIVRDFVLSHPVALYLNGHAGENREPHIVTPLHSLDGAQFDSIASFIEVHAGFTRARGALAGGAFNWAYWAGMERQRAYGRRPLALALEIYSDPAVEPASKAWWSRYNPPQGEMAAYLVRVRTVLMELTARSQAVRR